MPKIAWKDFLAGRFPPPAANPWQLHNLTTGEVKEPFYKDAGAFKSLLRTVTDHDPDDESVWELKTTDPRVSAYFNAEIERKLAWRDHTAYTAEEINRMRDGFFYG